VSGLAHWPPSKFVPKIENPSFISLFLDDERKSRGSAMFPAALSVLPLDAIQWQRADDCEGKPQKPTQQKGFGRCQEQYISAITC
jgi:hypothetical protein